MSWRDGMTPDQIREAEMARGQQVTTEKHGALKQLLAERFDPDYKPPEPTHSVSDEGKAYAKRLREMNRGRSDIK
jgi:hypothetical protein